MKVKILTHTPSPERVIAICGKLCYAGCTIDELEQNLTTEEIEKFVGMLKRLGHESPLEHVSFTFAVEGVSRVTEQQLTRHRHGSFCLSGDTIVYSDMKDRSVKKRTIKELYDIKKQYRDRIELRAIDENNLMIINNKIVDVIYSGEKDVYEVITDDGYKIKTTIDHRFFTNNGWKRLEDIDIKCDLLYTNGESIYKSREWLKQKYHTENMEQSVIADICNVSVHTIRAWVRKHNLQKDISLSQFKKGSTPHNKGLTKETYEPLAKTSENMKGNKNGEFQKKGVESKKYKQNITSSGGYSRSNRINRKNICSMCGKECKTEVHHADRNPKNSNLDNLIELCATCHKVVHNGAVVKHVKLSKIKSITKIGREDTYDISMEYPHHNFIANGFVVHNSIQSGRYVNRGNASFYTPTEIGNSDYASDLYNECIDKCKITYKEITDELLTILIEENSKTIICNLEDIDSFKEENPRLYGKLEKKAIENARMIFPNSLETKIIFTMNLRSLINFFNHRCCFRSQDEIRELANLMLLECKKVSPILFKDLGATCKTKGYCPEGVMQCEQLKGKVPTLKQLKDNYNSK